MAMREHGKATTWRVCFDGSFWGQKGRAGQELRVDRTTDWDGRMVCIPSVYLCGKGIVLDILTRAEPEYAPSRKSGGCCRKATAPS